MNDHELLKQLVRLVSYRPDMAQMHETGQYSLFRDMTPDQVRAAAETAITLLRGQRTEIDESLRIVIPGQTSIAETDQSPSFGWIPEAEEPGRIVIPGWIPE